MLVFAFSTETDKNSTTLSFSSPADIVCPELV